jgi:hypothetical protein
MDSKAMLLRMMSKDFRPDREVLLEEEPKFNFPNPILEKGGEGVTKMVGVKETSPGTTLNIKSFLR